MKRSLNRVWVIGAAALMMDVLCPLTAQRASKRILFIGNSLTYWNDGLDLHVTRMASSAEPPDTVTTGRAVSGGAFLKSLWAMRQPRQMIAEGRYDVVVLQEDLPETTIEDFRAHARLFVEDVRKSGARPVLLMAWSYPRLAGITMADIDRAHRDAAAELMVDVAPVGLAWRRAAEQRPDLNLYAPDGEHPSAYGTYLATAVLYATVLARNPTGLTYTPSGISAKDAAFLQGIAWETVRSFQTK
jgi:hypothetical protein